MQLEQGWAAHMVIDTPELIHVSLAVSINTVKHVSVISPECMSGRLLSNVLT
jgi:hypothetical protein